MSVAAVGHLEAAGGERSDGDDGLIRRYPKISQDILRIHRKGPIDLIYWVIYSCEYSNVINKILHHFKIAGIPTINLMGGL